MKLNRRFLLWLIVVLASATVFMCPPAPAKTKSSTSVTPEAISPLRPPSLVPAPNGNGEEKRPAFNATGIINSFEDDMVTVDDTVFKLGPQVKFYTRDFQITGRSGFAKGDFVGVVLDSAGKVKGLHLLQ